ncbi:MAG: hypothetical protein BJ554DRAFT_5827 [Olpidium bornovanus]|uniref:Riboflavin kinase n=1 Tax=Olpidium bornovanus TaxID=278681 RepID=A0A8H7ZYZ3_9FUNG|nr:MAG: hypothetical protein BJ554DRAFT_5827 [Olpidium bornovanus]
MIAFQSTVADRWLATLLEPDPAPIAGVPHLVVRLAFVLFFQVRCVGEGLSRARNAVMILKFILMQMISDRPEMVTMAIDRQDYIAALLKDEIGHTAELAAFPPDIPPAVCKRGAGPRRRPRTRISDHALLPPCARDLRLVTGARAVGATTSDERQSRVGPGFDASVLVSGPPSSFSQSAWPPTGGVLLPEDAAAAAAAQPAAAHAQRPRLVGPDAPEEPFPLFVAGEVVRGFGRGSRELGIPTEEVVSQLERLATGVYYGWARVSQVKDAAVLGDDEGVVYPMVMSVGWNPYYKNEKRSAVHIMHEFKADFYGARLAVAVLGYIRPELDYTTLGEDALISDINFDIKVANNCLARPAYKRYANHEKLLA